MATTAVDICNQALAHIGVGSITSLVESSEAARKCSVFYAQARDYVLRDHAWNFATSNEALAEEALESSDEWDYVYAYPAKALFIRRVYAPGSYDKDNPDPFTVARGPVIHDVVILSDVEDAYAEYTFQVEDVTLFDPMFVSALSFYLATLLAGPLTGDVATVQRVSSGYAVAIDRARQANISESSGDRSRQSTYEQER